MTGLGEQTADGGRGPSPRNAEIRALLVRSGNQCAFPNCTHPIVNNKNQFVAQVCHIEAASPGGPRFNPARSPEERGSSNNLLLLCYRHHVETNDSTEFTVQRLRDMKAEHERTVETGDFRPVDASVDAVRREADAYWIRVAEANTLGHIAGELRMEIDAGASTLEVIGDLREKLTGLRYCHTELWNSNEALNADIAGALAHLGYQPDAWLQQPYYENPAENRDWAIHAIYLRNLCNVIDVRLDQLELRCLELLLVQDPTNDELQSGLGLLKAKVLSYASQIGYID